MVKIDVEQPEGQALLKLIDDCSVNPEMGYALTMFKYKLIQAFKKEQKESEKEIEKDE